MSKKLAISFANINEETRKNVIGYTVAITALAKLSSAHSAKKKVLEEALEKAKNERAEDKRDSIIEELNALNAENEAYKKARKPFEDELKDIYKMIPVGMFDAYSKYINELKRGDMLTKVDEFLTGIGVARPSQKGVRQVCEHFTVKLGAKTASANKVLKNGVYTSTLGKTSFNKLFMGILADLLIDKGVIAVEAERVVKAEKASKDTEA